MPNPNDSIFDSLYDPFAVRRRKILSTWIKVFCWIFIALFAFILLCILMLILGGTAEIALYGLKLSTPVDTIGIIVILLYIFKGVVAIGLLTEKNWAVPAGTIDALLGIIICLFVMFVYPFFGHHLNFRWELIFLIPYYANMWKIKYWWREDKYTRQQALHNNYQ